MKRQTNKSMVFLIKGVIAVILILSPFWVHAFQEPDPLLAGTLDFDIRGVRARDLSPQEIAQIKTPAIENEIIVSFT